MLSLCVLHVWPRAAVVPLCTQLRAVSALALANETRARNAEARLLAAKSTTAAAEAAASPRKKVRVYIDGCFDMMHFGHWCVRVCASLSLPSGGVA
jgi:bifunctional ADP-heptose synthase (sugar kinase/adenylyltransferase)